MLSKSDTPVINIIKDLAFYGKEAAYLVPTDTGMKKSILDAHGQLRSFLLENGIHDFESQEQGLNGKKIVDVTLLGIDSVTQTKMSLYRPETKSGDPRLWIYGLPNYARPWNLLAFIVSEGQLYIFNASDTELFNSRNTASSPLHKLLSTTYNSLDTTALQLLDKLSLISKMGFVNSLRTGATGVGMTLETLLGIQANSNRAPDFYGIEIKATRVSGRKSKPKTRVNLFSQVPDWDISNFKSGTDILKRFGYIDKKKQRLQLYVTNSNQPNAQGLFLFVDEKAGMLESLKKEASSNLNIATWRMENLRNQLEAKHRRTFWVKAKYKKDSTGAEMFHYTEVEQTQSALSANIAPLIELGVITMDYTLSLKESGAAKDHGYLFKIHQRNFDLLFPPSTIHQLG